ncbi:MAG: PIN domain-containing protein, partial [Bacteroidota bacterium]
LDTNIAFSAILNTESRIGDLIMNSNGILEFQACETLRSELKKHRPKLLELSKMNEEQLDESIFQVTNCLHFTNEALIPLEYWLKAANLVRDIDMNDIAFVALAEFQGIKLWTGDRELMRGLAKKGYTNFISIDELIKLRSLIEQG